MTTNINNSVAFAIVTGLLCGCFTPTPVVNGPPVIVKQPVSRVKEAGTHVDFTVIAANIGPALTYQWCRNGSNVIGATNKTYCIEGVQMSHVASYTCKVSAGTNGTVLTQPAHLSVFHSYCTNPVVGVMAVPIGSFSAGSITIDGQAFDLVSGTYGNFYGRSCTGQVGDFQNYAHTKLTVDTYHSDNNQVNTGIRVSKLSSSWHWSNNNGIDAPTAQPLLSKTNLTLEATKKYKVTVYYVGPALSPTAQPDIKFNWMYHD